MCGIIGNFNQDKKVNLDIIEQYNNQRKRGTEGFGMIFINKDKSFKVNRGILESEMIYHMLNSKNQKQSIIFHHRKPSLTDNLYSQTHPIKVSNDKLKYDYYVIHNGYIYNHDELSKEHNKLKYYYNTNYKKDNLYKFNDSESIAIELARHIEFNTEIKAQGNVAFIALQINKKDNKINQIYFGTNKGDLKMAKTRNKLEISSEGKGADIKDDMLYRFNLDDYKLYKNKIYIPKHNTTTTPSYYPNYQSTYYQTNKTNDTVEKTDLKESNNYSKSKKFRFIESLAKKGMELHNDIADILDELLESIYNEKDSNEININIFKKSIIDILDDFMFDVKTRERIYLNLEKNEKEIGFKTDTQNKLLPEDKLHAK